MEPTPYQNREALIKRYGGGVYANMTQAQKDEVNAIGGSAPAPSTVPTGTAPNATDPITGQRVYIANPDLNPQFKYDTAAAAPGTATPGAPGVTGTGTSVGGVPSATPGGVAVTSPLDAATKSYYDSLPKSVNEDAIREQVRKNMQAQVDSVNVLYNNLRADQERENLRQEQRTRGVNLSAGLMGSDFASAAAAETEKRGGEALAALEREKTAKINEVLGAIDARATAQIEKETTQARANQKEYLTYLQDRQNAARGDIKTLAAGGVSLDKLSTDQYNKLLEQSGLDKFTFEALYNSSRPATAKIDYQYKIQGNQVFGYGIDPLTGKMKTIETTLPFNVPKEYKPQVLDNGQMVFYPETFDPSKPVKDQILTFDSGSPNDSKYLKELRGGLYNTRTNTWVVGPKADESTETGTRIKAATPAIEQLRDKTTGYIDPRAYSDMYQTFTKTYPGHGKEFLENFPVDIYVAPENRSMFSKTGY